MKLRSYLNEKSNDKITIMISRLKTQLDNLERNFKEQNDFAFNNGIKFIEKSLKAIQKLYK